MLSCKGTLKNIYIWLGNELKYDHDWEYPYILAKLSVLSQSTQLDLIRNLSSISQTFRKRNFPYLIGFALVMSEAIEIHNIYVPLHEATQMLSEVIVHMTTSVSRFWL